MRTTSPLLVLAFAAVLVAPATTHAQPATGQAEALFNEGIRLMDEGKLSEACAAFDASQRLEPALATLLNQAECRERNHQLATAWALFLEAERTTRESTKQGDREYHELAVQRAAALEPKLSKLTISVPSAVRITGLTVTRDGETVDPGAWDRPLPVDGGPHKLAAHAPGFTDWTGEVTVGVESDTKTIAVAALQPVPVVRDAGAGGVVQHVDRSAPSHVVPYSLAAAALVAGAAAVVFELSAEGTYDDSKVEADDAKQNSLFDSANHKRYLAEGIGIVGIGCLGVATWWYLSHRQPAERRLSVAPSVSTRSASVQVGFSF